MRKDTASVYGHSIKMLKKKGAASFKPRAPGRRPPTASAPPKAIEQPATGPKDTQQASVDPKDDRLIQSIESGEDTARYRDLNPSAPAHTLSVVAPIPASIPAPVQASQPSTNTQPAPVSVSAIAPDRSEQTASANTPILPETAKAQAPSSAPRQSASTVKSNSVVPSLSVPVPAAVVPSAASTAAENRRRFLAAAAASAKQPSTTADIPEAGLESPAASRPVARKSSTVSKKRKQSRAQSNIDPRLAGDDEAETDEDSEPEVRATKVARKSSIGKKPCKARKESTVDPDATPKKRGGRKREETPSDAEEQIVDHATLKMADLTRDLRIGKKFSRHDEIEKRDAERKAKLKARRENPNLEVSDNDERNPRVRTRVQTEEPLAETTGAGPRMRLVDGQIVIDETSLNLDRHKIAAENVGVMEVVEEDDFTRITTSATYMKREKNMGWNIDDEEKFYSGLRMFGTDFEMISKMFKNRSRRMIKLKFNKEERIHGDKITRTLLGEKVPINLEEYRAHTGLEYVEVDEINKEREEIAKAQADEESRVDAEMAETIRKKKDAIHGRTTADGGKEDSAILAARKKNVKPKRKNKANVYGGGEEVEDLGAI